MAKAKKSVMGRGLDAIFDANSDSESSGVTVLKISDIEPNKNQPRRNFADGSLVELATSIKAHGIIQPLIVRNSGDNFYQLIAGERRYRAAQMAGLTEVPVIIMDISPGEAAEVSVIENIQRVDLNPIEEAAAYKAIMDTYGLTQEQLSARLGKPRSTLANYLRMLDLPAETMELISKGVLSAGHAKALMGIYDKSKIPYAAELAVNQNLNVRATENLVKRLNTPQAPKQSEGLNDRSYRIMLEERMFAVLGRKVKINSGSKKTLEISYSTVEDLEELIKKLCGDDIFG